MDYLGKGEMLTNREVNKFVHNICDKLFVCISAHETWDTLHVAFIFLFTVFGMP